MGIPLLVISAISLAVSIVVSYITPDNQTGTYAQTYTCERSITDIFTNPASTLQLGTFRCPTATPTPTPTPTPTRMPTPTVPPGITLTPTAIPTIISAGGSLPLVTPAIGGPVPPSGYYCIDDVDPDMCDDSSSHLVPKGAGGVSGSCGTVIEQAHKLVMALPQDDKIDNGAGVRDYLLSAVSSACGSTGPYSKGQYVSTFFVIDAYNLAGMSELSKTPAFVNPSGLYAWWKSNPTGYSFVDYSPTVIQQFASGQKDLTGCVMFLGLGSGSYHIGIVNELEVFTSGGDGVLSILQAGTKMYIDRFPVVGWSVEGNSTNQTTTSGTVGFGCKA